MGLFLSLSQTSRQKSCRLLSDYTDVRMIPTPMEPRFQPPILRGAPAPKKRRNQLLGYSGDAENTSADGESNGLGAVVYVQF